MTYLELLEGENAPIMREVVGEAEVQPGHFGADSATEIAANSCARRPWSGRALVDRKPIASMEKRHEEYS